MVRRVVQFALTLLGLFGQLALPAASPQSPPRYDWLQFGGNAAHSNNNQREQVITRRGLPRMHLLFRMALPAMSDGAAVYLHHVHTQRGVLDLVFLSTIEGDTMALDAQTGATIWSHRYRNVPCSSTDSLACEAHTTPAIDPNRRYVYAYAPDGRVHKLAAGTGAETTSGGWPETATTKPSQEKSAGAVTIARSGGNTYLYVENGGYTSDSGDYQGHVTTVNLRTGQQHVFNMLCSERVDIHFQQGTEPDCPATQAAVWARAGVVQQHADGEPDTLLRRRLRSHPALRHALGTRSAHRRRPLARAHRRHPLASAHRGQRGVLSARLRRLPERVHSGIVVGGIAAL